LWALRTAASVDFHFPSNLPEPDAAAVRRTLLAEARRHHGIWLLVDGALCAASAPLILIPGPNLPAYYFGLRVVGHFLPSRGAGQGLSSQWAPHREPALAELASLAAEPRATRASRLEAIAASLNLPRLAAFFDRVAV